MSEKESLKMIQTLKTKGIHYVRNQLNIRVKKHSQYPELLLFKYDLLKSPFSNEAVRECRGLILRCVESDNHPLSTTSNHKKQYAAIDIICYPYKKFFNWNEKNSFDIQSSLLDEPNYKTMPTSSPKRTIDFASSRIYEKLDGSLCTLYFYKNQWHVSSSGQPDGEGFLPHAKMKFKELFWDVWNRVLRYKLPNDTSKCYMFELITPRHIIVVQPSLSLPNEDQAKNLSTGISEKHDPHERIVLHGARCLNTLKELLPEPIAHDNGWECVKSFEFNTFDDVIKAAKILNPMQMEGYVICDKHFNRVKVKSPLYVAIHHLKAINNVKSNLQVNLKQILQIVRMNESDEFLAYYPQYESLFHLVKQEYNKFLTSLEHLQIEELKDKNLQDVTSQRKFINTNIANKAFKQFEQSMVHKNCKKTHKFLNDAIASVVSGKFDSFAHYFAECDLDELLQFFSFNKKFNDESLKPQNTPELNCFNSLDASKQSVLTEEEHVSKKEKRKKGKHKVIKGSQ